MLLADGSVICGITVNFTSFQAMCVRDDGVMVSDLWR